MPVDAADFATALRQFAAVAAIALTAPADDDADDPGKASPADTAAAGPGEVGPRE